MAVKLEGDDFYRLPKHVQEQLRAQGLAPDEGVDEDLVEAIRIENDKRTEAARIAAEVAWQAAQGSSTGDGPRGAERPPEQPRGTTRSRDGPTMADYITLIVAGTFAVLAVLIGMVAPVEIAAVPAMLAVAAILIRIFL